MSMDLEQETRAQAEPGRSPSPAWGLRLILAAGILLLGTLPPALWWWSVARVPTVDIREALASSPHDTGTSASRSALVDVRSPEAFQARHVEGSVSWPLDDVLSFHSASDLPVDLRGKRLLLICDVGVSSAQAVRHLNELGLDARNVEGGTRMWFAAIAPPPADVPTPVDPADREHKGITFREATPFEQFMEVQGGFTLKPIYMLLSLVLIWVLRREQSVDLIALRWSMIFFFLGEFFCYLNFFLFGDDSRLTEYLHSYGMVVAAGFGAYAFFEGVDRRLVRFSAQNERCSAAALCRPCAKHSAAPCAFKRLFQFLIPAFMVLALLPLCAEPQAVCYDTRLWGTPYNYCHPLVYQMYEIYACPLSALLLLGTSWLILLFKKNEAVAAAKMWCAAGLGFLSFSIFRLLLYAPFRDKLLWFEFWEEATELLSIAAVAVVLWAFRKGLWTEQKERVASNE
jgi:rhodanese-related sulfurtransferase